MPGPRRELTVREIKVLRLVATGLTNRGIAMRLGVSEHTVAAHLRKLYGKLGLNSRAAAVSWYERHLRSPGGADPP
jgi:DNA-binding CsgD family transcriptional regulator